MSKANVARGCVAAALGAALGAATAPAGMPLAGALLRGSRPDLSRALAILPGDDLAAGWARWMRRALSADGGPALLALWCAVCAAALAGALCYRRLKKPERRVEGGVLGDARLIESTAEIRRKNDFWDGRGTPPSAGLAIGCSPKGYVYDSSVPHWAVVGKTGSGKSWLMVIPTLHLCMARGWNLIVTGKAELLELTGDKAEELGYRRVVFDLKGYPGASRFNPLDLVVGYAEAGDVGSAQRAARQLAADLVPLGGEANAYFPKAARSALTACLLVVALADIPRERKNMASVCRLVALGTAGDGRDPSAPLKDYIRGPEVGPGHPAFAPASEFLSDGGVTTAGKNVLSTLKEALSIFGDEGVARATAASDVPIRDIVREKTVVYMHLLEEGDPYLAIMTAFLDQYWRVAQEEADANGGRLPRETAIVGDEWGNLPAVAAMPEIATLGRSYRLHAWCFTQDLKQWNKYGRPGDQNAGRDKILGSMGGKVALSLASPDDFDYFTRLAGKRTVRARSEGTSRQGSGASARGGSSEGYSERADDLVHAWEWQGRIPARDGVVAIKGGENSAPGREGVFQIPVTYASRTPAAAFFGLGSEAECDAKRAAFRRRMEDRAAAAPAPPEPWAPDFGAVREEGSPEDGIEGDELAAWD
jgi:type IV secretory pathway TraG/TraD family ATPase VirD4